MKTCHICGRCEMCGELQGFDLDICKPCYIASRTQSYKVNMSSPDVWVSVKHKLPLYKQCVIGCLNKFDMFFVVFRGLDENGNPWFTDQNNNNRDIAYWMPEPEPPK